MYIRCFSCNTCPWYVSWKYADLRRAHSRCSSCCGMFLGTALNGEVYTFDAPVAKSARFVHTWKSDIISTSRLCLAVTCSLSGCCLQSCDGHTRLRQEWIFEPVTVTGQTSPSDWGRLPCKHRGHAWAHDVDIHTLGSPSKATNKHKQTHTRTHTHTNTHKKTNRQNTNKPQTKHEHKHNTNKQKQKNGKNTNKERTKNK